MGRFQGKEAWNRHSLHKGQKSKNCCWKVHKANLATIEVKEVQFDIQRSASIQKITVSKSLP